MDQLQKIFDVIGTPSEDEWPVESAVQRNNFKSCPPKEWRDVVPEMDHQAQDLVKVRIESDCSFNFI